MKRHLFFFPFLLLCVSAFAADAIRIQSLSGQEQNVALQNIGKITFARDTMFLLSADGSVLGQTAVADIGKITFGDAVGDAVQNLSSPSLRVYPNPAQNILYVQGLKDDEVVRVYSLQGVLITAVKAVEGSAQINVTDLSTGTWILQTGAQLLKFIKD